MPRFNSSELHTAAGLSLPCCTFSILQPVQTKTGVPDFLSSGRGLAVRCSPLAVPVPPWCVHCAGRGARGFAAWWFQPVGVHQLGAVRGGRDGYLPFLPPDLTAYGDALGCLWSAGKRPGDDGQQCAGLCWRRVLESSHSAKRCVRGPASQCAPGTQAFEQMLNRACWSQRIQRRREVLETAFLPQDFSNREH